MKNKTMFESGNCRGVLYFDVFIIRQYVDVLIILTCDCYDGVKLIDGII